MTNQYLRPIPDAGHYRDRCEKCGRDIFLDAEFARAFRRPVLTHKCYLCLLDDHADEILAELDRYCIDLPELNGDSPDQISYAKKLRLRCLARCPEEIAEYSHCENAGIEYREHGYAFSDIMALCFTSDSAADIIAAYEKTFDEH